MSDYKKAIDFFGKIISAEGVSDRKKGTAYHNLGQCYASLENYDLAEEYYLLAVLYNEKLEEKNGLLISMIDLAEVYINMAEEEKAISYLERALTVYDDIDAKPEYYNVYKLLAMAYAGKDPGKTRHYIARYGECNDAFIKIQQELKDLEVNRAFNLEVEQFQMAREIEGWEENLDNLWEQYWVGDHPFGSVHYIDCCFCIKVPQVRYGHQAPQNNGQGDCCQSPIKDLQSPLKALLVFSFLFSTL